MQIIKKLANLMCYWPVFFRYEFCDVLGLESETESGDYVPHHLLVADFRSKTDHVVIIVEDIV